MKMTAKAKGYIIGAIAAATYGLNPLFALPCYKGGMNPDSVLFFRYLIAIPIMATMLLARGHNFAIEKRQALPLAAMGILMAVSSLALFLSYNYMSSGIASTLLFVYPVMVAVIMATCFKEKLNITTGLCIILALAGIGMLYNGSDGESLSLIGTMLVMVSSLSYAIYIVGVNRPTLANIPSLKLTLYALCAGLLVFGARFACGQELTVPTSGHIVLWLNLIGLAIFPTAISFLCTTRAIQLIGSTPTAILGALEPLTATVIGMIVFGETLTMRDVFGIVLIITAVSIVVGGSAVARYLMRFRKMFPRIKRR